MVSAVSAWVLVVGTIGGALVGVVAGGLVTWFVEKERWKREDRTRWHPDRRQVYVRFLQLADAYSVAGTHFADAVAILFASQAATGQAEVNEAHAELIRAIDALRPFEWEIDLVGGREVRTAAAEVVKLVSQQRVAEVTAVRKRDIDDAFVAAANKAVEDAAEAVEKFKRAARAEVGLDEPDRGSDSH